jgi:endonuclease/exonuclease/phosphatase family metal-dependent hydrolase
VRVRLVTYNVRGFRDDGAALLAVVRGLAPDVLVLNETGARRRLRRLAGELEMQVAADPWSPLRRRVKDAVLARPPWTIAEHRQQRFARSTRFYPRGALFARLERVDASWWVVAIHLGLRRAERLRHVDELLAATASLYGPLVIAGDTNERPEGPAIARLCERFDDAWIRAGDGPDGTMPARAPIARIDDVFVSRDVVVTRAFVPQHEALARASDHRPVVVDLEIG